jgi:hypothetical protein
MTNATLTRIAAAFWEPYWPFAPLRRRSEDRTVFQPQEFTAVVSGLCPTLDVTIRVAVPGDEARVLIAPNDWTTLEESLLLDRIYGCSPLSRRPAWLSELRDERGSLLGRVGYAGTYGYAAIANGGIRNGSVPKLGGIVLGVNNSDLVRLHSKPLASHEAWKRWAEHWLDAAESPGIDALIDVHALCPQRDLAVYRVAGTLFTAEDLREWLRAKSELHVIYGPPEHEDDDDVSPRVFDSQLQLSARVLVVPLSDGRLEQALSIQRIAYGKRLKRLLEEAWSQFEEFEEDDVVVAEVGDVEIRRSVTGYQRMP